MRVIMMIGLLSLALLSGCVVTDQAKFAKNAVEDYFDDEVTIDDMEVPLAGVSEITLGRPGDIGTIGDMAYSVVGVRLKEDFLYIDMEVQNQGSSTLEFRPEAYMALYDSDEMAGFPYEMSNLRISDRKLYGILQPGNRIGGTIAFAKPKMVNNRVYLFLGNDRDEAFAFEISRGDDGYEGEGTFANGEIFTALSLGSHIESGQFNISLKEVAYDLDEKGNATAACKISVKNVSDSQKVFLVGYNVVSVHDLQGNALSVDAKEVTVPKVIEPGDEVTGIIPVSLTEEGQAFYMTFRPDEGDFDDLSIVMVRK